MPYIHGPQEDENPLMDYIIKSHKYQQSDAKARTGGALASLRPDGASLAHAGEGKTRAAYLRTVFFKKRRDLMQLGAD